MKIYISLPITGHDIEAVKARAATIKQLLSSEWNEVITTTSEQSQRLLRCGVSADTADMMFTPHNTLSTEPYKDALKDRGYIPAWSLSALLGLLPDIITYGGYQWGMFMTKLSKDSVSCAKWGILIRHMLAAIRIYLNLLAFATIASTKLIAPTSLLRLKKMEMPDNCEPKDCKYCEVGINGSKRCRIYNWCMCGICSKFTPKTEKDGK